jgi:GntR family transcriptional repressor for pyruvate dehydrogenase complex
VFRPVLTVHGSRQVFEQIKRSIETQTLKPGARLPSERELAASFGVSRTTVREAIQSLASVGLLEVRQGFGTVVSSRATTLEDPAYWLPWLTEHRSDIVALLQVREALEVKSAALAAQAVIRVEPGANLLLLDLEHNLRKMEEASETLDIRTLERVDLEFHALLAQMSGNRYLVRLSKSINHVFADRRAAMAIPGRAPRSCLEHRGIVAAVSSGKSAAAGEAMSIHLHSVREAVDKLRAGGGAERGEQ